MRSHPFSTHNEAIESQHVAGRYNPGLEITFRPTAQKETVTFPIGAGTRDQIDLFRSKGNKEDSHTDWYVFISFNRSLDYVGSEVFTWSDRENRWEAREDLSVFLQNEEQIKDILGPQGLDLCTHNIARRLLQRIS